MGKILIHRTETPNYPPPALDPGELSIEMADPQRLWVGVPTTLDPAGKVLLFEKSAVFTPLFDPGHWSWMDGVNRELITAVGPVIAAPSDELPGTSREILIKGVDDSPLTVRFEGLGSVPEVRGVTDVAWCFVRLYCVDVGVLAVTASLVTDDDGEAGESGGIPENGALTDPAHWSWNTAKNLELIAAVSPLIAAPEGGESGTLRTILVKGVDDSPLTVTFDTSLGLVPDVAGVTDTAWCFVRLYCVAEGMFAVTAALVTNDAGAGIAEKATMSDPGHWDWNTAKSFELIASVGPIIAAPSGAQAGEHRTILIKGVDDSPLPIGFDSAFGTASPTAADMSSVTWYLADILCVDASSFIATLTLAKSDLTPVEMIDPQHWDWRTAANRELTVNVNTVISGPANAQAGTRRNIAVRSADGEPRKITFDSSFIGIVPTVEVTDARIEVFCLSPSANTVTVR